MLSADRDSSGNSSCRRLQTIHNHLMASMNRSPLTTHVLDAAKGQPASGMTLRLHRKDTTDAADTWSTLFVGVTDADGRCPGIIEPQDFVAGTYKLSFDTETYFANQNVEGFYPLVEIAFHIRDCKKHHHVPLLLSPYAYSTYRGS